MMGQVERGALGDPLATRGASIGGSTRSDANRLRVEQRIAIRDRSCSVGCTPTREIELLDARDTMPTDPISSTTAAQVRRFGA
jgi:hypothetical protein